MNASDPAFYVLVTLHDDGPGTAQEISERLQNQKLAEVEAALKSNEAGGNVKKDNKGVWSVSDSGKINLEVERRR